MKEEDQDSKFHWYKTWYTTAPHFLFSQRTCAEFLCGLNEGSLVPDPDDGLLNLDVEGLDGEGRVESVSLLVSQGPEVRPSLSQLALFLHHVLRVGMVHVEQLMRQLIHHVHLAGVDVHLRLKTRESRQEMKWLTTDDEGSTKTWNQNYRSACLRELQSEK